MSLFRPTLRVRMALLYGGLVLLVGISLLVTSIVLLDNAITSTSGGQPPGAVMAARDKASHYLYTYGLLFFAIIVIVGTLGGYMLARQSLRPIARLTQTARALSTDNLDQRIDLGGPDDELRELADTFDDMLGRLDAAFDSQRLFVANASHELRTPLSVIRTELEVTLSDPDADATELRRMGSVVEQATERAQRLVTSLLTLARLQAVGGKGPEVSEPVDLAWLVPAAINAVAAEADQKGVHIETDVQAADTLGDPRLLERLIGNLIENGIRHNVPDGWLRIRTGQSASKAWLHVANGGAVIGSEDVERLFEPFRRGGRARTATRGAGLGLAIVRLIVETHGGKLSATAPPFGGLSIRIELPRGPDDEALLAAHLEDEAAGAVVDGPVREEQAAEDTSGHTLPDDLLPAGQADAAAPAVTGTGRAARRTAATSAGEATGRPARSAPGKAAGRRTRRASGTASGRATGGVTGKASGGATGEASGGATGGASGGASRKVTGNASGASGNTSGGAARKATGKTGDKTGDKASGKPASRTGRNPR